MEKATNSASQHQHAHVPIAIIGIGCMFPKSRNLQEYWSNLREGTDGISDIPETHWDPQEYFDSDPKSPDKTYAKRGGFLPPIDFDPLAFGILPNALEATDTSQLLSLVAAQEALRDAGYLDRDIDRDRVSVIIGITGAQELVIPLGARLGHPIWRKALKEAGLDDELTQDVVERISQHYVEWQENSFPGLLGNVVAGRIANKFDFGGTNCVVDAACASSLSAIHLAMMELSSGKSDMVLTGGVDTFNHIFMYVCFSKTPALSPSGYARPFDHQSDGTTLGEGVGIVVLKRLEDAKRDKDKIYAVIKGMGTSSDGKGTAIYAPSVAGQVKAYHDAYQEARVSPDSIELIEAHGTGTAVGDATEIKSLREAYHASQTNGAWCALGSVKSQIGHAKAAAGIAGLIKAAMALHYKVLPPTIHIDKPAAALTEETTPFYVNTEKRPWVSSEQHPRRAGVSAFGFGGANFHCVLEECAAQKPQIDWSGNTQILAWSADTTEELQTDLSEMTTDQDWDDLRRTAAKLRHAFQATHKHRLLIVAEREKSDLSKLLKNAQVMLEKNQAKTSWNTPDGIFYGQGNIPGKLGIIFPGQGSQYVGMLRDVSCQFPQMQDVLDTANQICGCYEQNRRLSDLIYPQPTFTDEDFQQNAAALQSTEVAQPAIGAVSLGALKIIEHFGVAPDSVAGHSYGELVALCAAGVLDVETFFAMSKLRGQLMGQKSGDKGSMLAVQGDLDSVMQLVNEEQIDLVIANKNSPRQTVLSGATSEVERAAGLLKKRGVRCKQLNVAAAFHSSFVSDASGAFLQALREIEIHPSQIPVYADSTAERYPDDIEKVRELLAGQLANPVEFVGIIENMYASGVRTFVEIGPSSQMKGLINAILDGKPTEVFSLDASKGSRSGDADLARVLSQIGASGYSVSFTAWDDGVAIQNEVNAQTTTRKMSVPISGANYVKPRAPKPPLNKMMTSVPNNGSAQQHPRHKTMLSQTMPSQPIPTTAAGTREEMAHQQAEPSQQAELQTVSPTRETSGRKESKLASQNTPASQAVRSVTPQTTSPIFPEALRMTQENLRALQQFQQQTADLHRQFLEGQEATRQSFERLFSQQQHLLLGQAAAFQDHLQQDGASGVSEQPERSYPSVVEAAVTPISPAAATSPTMSTQPVQPVQTVSAAAVEPRQETPSPANDLDQIEHTLLNVVAEKTGYPVEMLDLDMELDGDLGIDSIKRVEILSALQAELPDMSEITSDQIGTIHSLRQIVDVLATASPALHEEQDEVPSGLSASGTDSLQVEKVLLEVVSEKTGYPEEMLDLDMGLDADLGIDSIKRVEILSALQSQLPGAPEIGSELIGQIQNLRQIVDFLSVSVVTPPSAKRTTNAAPQGQPGGLDSNQVKTVLLQVVAEKTGYPEEMLDLDMGLDADLGIDSIKRVEILSALQSQLPEAPEINSDQIGQIQNLRQIVEFLSDIAAAQKKKSEISVTPSEMPKKVASADLDRHLVTPVELARLEARRQIALRPGATLWLTDDGSDLASALEKALQEKGFHPQRISWKQLDSLKTPDSLGGVIILAPAGTSIQPTFLSDALRLAQLTGPVLRHHPSLFITVSRLDGAFGFGPLDPANAVLSGGLAGLVKTIGQEWPGVSSKAIDVAETINTEDAAVFLLEEMFLSGPPEVGISGQGRISLQLNSVPLQNVKPTHGFTSEDVVLITGGARGVTAECAVALARAFQPTIVLLGRSEPPTAEPEWLVGLNTEKEIKQAIISHADRKMTPKEAGQAFQRIRSNREISRNIERIEASGAKVLYRSVDVRDIRAVQTVVHDLQQECGIITGLIHGAGVLADSKIENKTREQFERVYGTKVEGLLHLLDVLEVNPLKAIVLFSSTTARFGRIGQADYAIANEVLNKIAQQQARLRPECRVLAINWGPWAGGMVTPELEHLFRKEGIQLIPLRTGAEYLVQELSVDQESPKPVEILILGKNSQLPASLFENMMDEPPDSIPEDQPSLALAFERILDIEHHPFLRSHVIDGRAVLPMAITIEWLAHAALHNNPGFVLHGFDELRILKGVVLPENKPLTIQVRVGHARKDGKNYLVPVEMHSVNGNGQPVRHARAEFVLTMRLPRGEPSLRDVSMASVPYHAKDVYQQYLFHGPDFHGIEQIEGVSPEGIIGTTKAAPQPSAWIKQPLRNHWLTDPLIVDSSFQMMILWSFAQYQSASLPTFIRRYRQFLPKFSASGGRVIAQVTKSEEHSAQATIEFLDEHGALIARMEEYECTIDPSLNEAFRRNSLAEKSEESAMAEKKKDI